MYLHRTPSWLTWLYPQLIWHKSRIEPKVYISFDDGPVPEVTPWVLDTLERFQAKGTFFCVGENIKNNPELFQEISDRGHAVGNHTYSHINGWETPVTEYVENVSRCQVQMRKSYEDWIEKPFMRPPYGRIKRAQIHRLIPEFQIVMWDVLTGDFDQRRSPKECLGASIKASRKGSIVIFHDSLKAKRNLTHILPRFLEHFALKDFAFPTL